MSEPPDTDDDPVIPVFMPALVLLLVNAERLKGSPLVEDEVLKIRDNGVCIGMRTSHAIALDEQRGYEDIDPEQCWEQWQSVREQLTGEDGGGETE